MNHLNVKSLTFYGVAIGSVLLLFKTVTAYGENNLKAPPVVEGRYLLTLATKLPSCEAANSLVLNMQQSGIYLNASLVPVNPNAETEQPSLTGILKNQQISFSGKVDPKILCLNSKSQTNSNQSVAMQIQLIDQDKITGQITVNSIPQTLRFTAAKQSTPEKSQKVNPH
ncbi:hypothetical protein BCD64_16630 [Nostoc sp. MBR 210]|uniref:Uncharacterized protein n=1 Tax=Nostoc spongiaeforme FACHB-130 TaxID=1357510 RepID=A0ABR8G0Q7_9NOSO|nr:hypothetical protein [Nostoc spongiaeforme]MBD2596796.1 hypothetical protein [Nostoc spongiaeforme FACHB-130]OCQ97180.1 hypothetical protein BCD64_16630 [Nostoc sp. MBR 210]